MYMIYIYGFPDGSDGKESLCNAGDQDLIPGVRRKIPQRREWLPAPIFLPGELHVQRTLAGLEVHRVAKSRTCLSDYNTFTYETKSEVQVLVILVC